MGLIAAKAIISKKVCNLRLTKSFLKHIIGKPLCVNDLEDVEPDVERNLMYILENNIDDPDFM